MKSDELLDAIGEVKDEYIRDVRNGSRKKRPGWVKWTSALAACLALVIGVGLILGGMGANGGSGSDGDLHYMYYVGPVLPMTVQGDPSGITAVRNVNYDFAGYCDGEPVVVDRRHKALVTDSYILSNDSDEDRTVTLLYPFTGDMRQWAYYPSITVDGEATQAILHPGPYSGGFEGAWGSNEAGTVNLKYLDCFEDYQTLLATNAYRDSAFDEFPVLDQKVYVYRLHDFVYSESTEDVNPTLSFTFRIDYKQATVMSYGMNGASWDYESGYCSRRKGGIEYRPNVAPERQHPDDGYVILIGHDLDSYTLQGYKDGGCDKGEELNDLSCTITRYETTLGDILDALLEDYLDETAWQMDSSILPGDMPLKELYLGLASELLFSYGILGDTPMERYDVGMVEDLFSAASNDSRVIYLSFDVTIPAGESVAVEAAMLKDASIDYIGSDKGKDGYDMATRLGSNLTFTEQTASISRYEQIEIVAQNFGFDPVGGVSEVTLDLNQDHYWMEIRKIKAE